MEKFPNLGKIEKKDALPKVPEGKFLAGAVKRPDGTWDTSRATFMDRPKMYKEEREERMRIPESAKPGTANHVFYQIRNAQFVNEQPEQNENESARKRREENIKRFKNQMYQLESFGKDRDAEFRERIQKGEQISFEQRQSPMDAADALRYLEKRLELSESELDKLKPEERAGSRTEIEIADLKDLRMKLDQEALQRQE